MRPSDPLTVQLDGPVAAAVRAVAAVDGSSADELAAVAVAGWLTQLAPAFVRAADALTALHPPVVAEGSLVGAHGEGAPTSDTTSVPEPAETEEDTDVDLDPCDPSVVVLEDGRYHCLADLCTYDGGVSAQALRTHLARLSDGHRLSHVNAVATELGL